MPVDHYENFPVASWVMPKRLRRPVEAIYAFARSADDIADEGDAAPDERLAGLSAYREELARIQAGDTPQTPLFQRLAVQIAEWKLPLEPFYDLLSAFEQDVTQKRYADFGDVMQYCRRSANPVGRLLLHLYDAATPRNIAMSDGICSALQLINFWQDVAIDWQKDRVYLPQDDLARFGVTEEQIARGDTGGGWTALMQFQIERTRRMLEAGAPLALVLPGRIGFELRMIVAGGERILKKTWDAKGDVFRHRPVLRPLDWLYILQRAVLKR